MKRLQNVSQKKVRELFDYHRGKLYWKKSGQGRRKNLLAGNIRDSGYTYIKINGKLYLAHRLIFLLFYGFLPVSVGHTSKKLFDDSIGNLYEIYPKRNIK